MLNSENKNNLLALPSFTLNNIDNPNGSPSELFTDQIKPLLFTNREE